MKGFFGKVMIGDATKGKVEVQSLDPSWLRESLGGKGLGLRLLMEHSVAGCDPLSPLNPVVFAVGFVTDTRIYGSARYVVMTKSPQTGYLCHSYSGGKLAEKMSRCGIDALVLTGASKSPVYLEVTGEGGRFVEADELWGLDIYEAEERLIKRYGTVSKAGAAVIGLAGERMIPFAIVANDKWRCAGRGGAGAVLGSKKLKGVVFSGDKQRVVADLAGIDAFSKKLFREKKDHPAVLAYKNSGTPMMVALMNTVGGFPTGYWKKGRMEGHEGITDDAMQLECDVKPKACPRCFLACGKLTTVRHGRHAGLTVEGPEYETLYAFGGLCGIDEIAEIVHLNDLCDRLGMDTITAGNLVGFAMEASKRGFIKEEIAFGDADVATGLLEDIANRVGVGGTLAFGIREAARRWGCEELAVHVKGMEPAGYDPRALKGMGLAYAVSDRGACHLRATFYKPELSGMIPPEDVEGKAELFLDFEDRATLFDGMVLCRFFRDLYEWDELTELFRLGTGLDVDKDELKRIAANIANLSREFNLREGLTERDDWLPDRIFDEPLADTGASLSRDELAKMRSDYYTLRGWNKESK